MDADEIAKKMNDLIDAVTKLRKQLDDVNLVKDAAKSKEAKEAAEKIAKPIKELIEKQKKALLDLVKKLEGEGWKLGKEALEKLRKKLLRVGIPLNKALGAEQIVSKGLGVLGKLLGAIADILLNPSVIGGLEERVVDSMIIQIGDKCLRIDWYQLKSVDELIWSDPKVRVSEIDCPEKVVAVSRPRTGVHRSR